jgi:hypothetical protein
MSLLDQLKGLFHFDFPNLQSIFKFTLIVNSNNNNKFESDNETGTIKVNWEKLTESERSQLRPIIKEEYEKSGYILEDNAHKLIFDFKEQEKIPNFQEVFDYFKEKIPPSDINILRAALYLRVTSEKRGEIAVLKGRIVQQYGMRGRNVTNLCSAGYFEGWLKPLYEDIEKTEEDKAEVLRIFRKIYNNIVEELPWTVFVGFTSTEDGIKKEIIEKMENNKKYGIPFLNIHAIGKANISKIHAVLPGVEKALQGVERYAREGENRIFVKLEIKAEKQSEGPASEQKG